ncbi:MAG TPA: hypothetical protein VGX68_10300 [Thermoanaerobaculia bacterium]|jgi:hypothetical protein|nr:hypothetical protein [Thermoanaerobaculia bacterium]
MIDSLFSLHGWSSHSAAVDLGPPEPQDCTACGSKRTVRLWFLYGYCAMAWVFGIVSRKPVYALVCGTCGARKEVPEEEAKFMQTKPAHIPFLRRYGLMLIIGLPILWVTIYLIMEFAWVLR